MTDNYDGLLFLYNHYVSPTLLHSSLLSLHFLYIPHLDTMTVRFFFVYVQNYILAFLRMKNLVMCHPNPIMTVFPTDGLRS